MVFVPLWQMPQRTGSERCTIPPMPKMVLGSSIQKEVDMLHSVTKPGAGERCVSSPIIIAFICVSTLWLVSSVAIIGCSAVMMA